MSALTSKNGLSRRTGFQPVQGDLHGLKTCATVALLLFMSGMASAALPTTQPRTIAVVKTFEDLAKQEPIDIGEGVQVRVGIEATKATAGSGVLLYCLAEGKAARLVMEDVEGVLGPFGVTVEKVGRLQAEHLSKFRRATQEIQATEVLWRRGVILPEAGQYDVALWRERDRPLAAVRIDATEPKAQPWLTLRTSRLERGAGDEAIHFEASAEPNEVALPSWEGDGPILVVGGARESGEGLPSFHPQEQHLKLTRQAMEFVLSAEHGSGLSFHGGGDHLLARWWINGKSYIPSRVQVKVRQWSGPVMWRSAKSVHLAMHFKPDDFGARKGDRMAVQIMHCDVGIAFPDMALHRMVVMPPEQSDVPRVRMSNRVEFVVE